MKRTRYRFAVAALAGSALLGLTACGGSSGGAGPDAGASSGAKTEITLLVDNGEGSVKAATAVVAAFEKANPDITVKLNSRPGGGDGDNLVKTKLSTGEMEDVLWYNSGSLLQALAPEKNLVDLTGDPALKDTDPSFLPAVTQGGKVYGAPWGTAFGGGILYNKDVYAKLGLTVPKTWVEFEANSEKIKAAGIDPVIQTYKDTWTSQLLVLGDFYNVSKANPNFAADYTSNKVKFASDPVALRGFEKLAEVKAKGWVNKSAGSMTFDQGMKYLAAGKGAQYPMLTSVLTNLPPADGAKIGFFGLPGDDAASVGATLWTPGGQYIPKASKHIDAAKKFVGFVASPAGAEVYTSAVAPTGPYLIKGATLPADVLPVAKDMQAYIDAGNISPALEFLSPIKGPALEQICVAVGSGQTSAKDGASQYDADVTKQAKQLGLAGW